MIETNAVVVIVAAAISATPPTLMALAALRQGVKNGEKAQEAVTKTDQLVTKTTEIHELTNGNLSKVTAQLETANQKIEGLEKLIGAITKNRREGDS